MSYSQTILPEFDHEMANTRKVLAVIPDSKLEWQAHPKMRTIGWNANHLVEIASWVEGVLTRPDWDLAPPGGPAYQSPKLGSVAQILAEFDHHVEAAKKAIAAVHDDEVTKMWSLLHAGSPIFTMPRSAVIRSFVLSHTVHHRAHLIVYLRLNEVETPGMYGPAG